MNGALVFGQETVRYDELLERAMRPPGAFWRPINWRFKPDERWKTSALRTSVRRRGLEHSSPGGFCGELKNCGPRGVSKAKTSFVEPIEDRPEGRNESRPLCFKQNPKCAFDADVEHSGDVSRDRIVENRDRVAGLQSERENLGLTGVEIGYQRQYGGSCGDANRDPRQRTRIGQRYSDSATGLDFRHNRGRNGDPRGQSLQQVEEPDLVQVLDR